MKHNKLLPFGLALLAALLATTPVALAQTIPPDRIVQWDPGVRTDWSVTRTTVCTTLSPSGDGDDADNIEAALSNCPAGQVVKLTAGTFQINSAINWPKSGVTLRGEGPTSTILQGRSSFSGDKFFDFYSGHGTAPDWDWSRAPSRTLSATGLSKDSTQIHTSSPHGWQTGDYILIDQDNQESASPPWDDMGYGAECNWCSRMSGERLLGQIARVSVVDADTVNIDPPLYANFSASQNAVGIEADGHLYDISVESLGIDNTMSNATNTFYSYGLDNSLFYNLDLNGVSSNSRSMHFKLFNGLWNTIRHCTLRNALSNQTNNGYGVFFGFSTTANLFEDNICTGLVLCVAMEGSAAGHVVAYNFAGDSVWYDSSANRLPILGHGGGSHMALIEGNYIEGRFRSDNYFGTQHRFTLLRNRIVQQPGKEHQTQTVDLEEGSHYSNIVGNVLGTNGYETVYECENTACSAAVKAIYRLGYEGAYDSDAGGNDGQVKATQFRHGNYDTVTQSTKYCGDAGEPGCQGGSGSQTLPSSLYLSSKPSWFGNSAWPPIGPDRSPMVQDIPAVLRHNGQPAPPPPELPAAPQNLTATVQ